MRLKTISKHLFDVLFITGVSSSIRQHFCLPLNADFSYSIFRSFLCVFIFGLKRFFPHSFATSDVFIWSSMMQVNRHWFRFPLAYLLFSFSRRDEKLYKKNTNRFCLKGSLSVSMRHLEKVNLGKYLLSSLCSLDDTPKYPTNIYRRREWEANNRVKCMGRA